jgi:hypothetical protein
MADDRLSRGYRFSFPQSHNFKISHPHVTTICEKCGLVCDLRNVDFLDLEILQTRENDFLLQSGAVGVNQTKIFETFGVCVAVIGNNKRWTPFGIKIDCSVLFLDLQRKSSSSGCCATSFSHISPFHTRDSHSNLSETTEVILVCLQNHSQSVFLTVTSALKLETAAIASPQNPDHAS